MKRSDGLHVLPWDKPKEKSVEGPAVKRAEELGWWQNKIEKASKDGMPDRVFIKDGRTVWIEMKRPKGKARALQALRHKEMREHGAEVYVCDTVEGVVLMLEAEV